MNDHEHDWQMIPKPDFGDLSKSIYVAAEVCTICETIRLEDCFTGTVWHAQKKA